MTLRRVVDQVALIVRPDESTLVGVQLRKVRRSIPPVVAGRSRQGGTRDAVRAEGRCLEEHRG